MVSHAPSENNKIIYEYDTLIPDAIAESTEPNQRFSFNTISEIESWLEV